ncbi:MAG: helix-turn-helix domain-containing protein [Corynebacterium nuruki]|nr:helix-turn-helix domain-containing protein [Corynebacterium nuruki]
MPTRGHVPVAVRRAERTMGENLRNQRKLLGLTATMVAERADVSPGTLRNIEHGEPARSEALLKVLRVLGMLDAVVAATDPYRTDVGVLRANEQLPQRVRVPREGDGR